MLGIGVWKPSGNSGNRSLVSGLTRTEEPIRGVCHEHFSGWRLEFKFYSDDKCMDS